MTEQRRNRPSSADLASHRDVPKWGRAGEEKELGKERCFGRLDEREDWNAVGARVGVGHHWEERGEEEDGLGVAGGARQLQRRERGRAWGVRGQGHRDGQRAG